MQQIVTLNKCQHRYYTRNMDWKRIIILRYDIFPILSMVHQFVILFVVTPAAI